MTGIYVGIELEAVLPMTSAPRAEPDNLFCKGCDHYLLWDETGPCKCHSIAHAMHAQAWYKCKGNKSSPPCWYCPDCQVLKWYQDYKWVPHPDPKRCFAQNNDGHFPTCYRHRLAAAKALRLPLPEPPALPIQQPPAAPGTATRHTRRTPYANYVTTFASGGHPLPPGLMPPGAEAAAAGRAAAALPAAASPQAGPQAQGPEPPKAPKPPGPPAVMTPSQMHFEIQKLQKHVDALDAALVKSQKRVDALEAALAKSADTDTPEKQKALTMESVSDTWFREHCHSRSPGAAGTRGNSLPDP